MDTPTNNELIALLERARAERWQELDLSERCDSSQVALLAEHLPRLAEHLTSLDFRWNSIGDEGAASLVAALQGLPGLTSLGLGANRLGDKGVASLATALQGVPSLTSLDLSYNNIGDEGTASLATALQGLVGLTSLGLSRNRIGAEGAVSLATVLQRFRRFTSLDLRHNRIGGEGAASLATVLLERTDLTSLDFGWNNIGAKGAASLATALHGLASLTSLDLHSNSIGDEGAASLATALPGLTSLTSLGLSRNRIGDEGAASLAAVLPGLESLTSLNLRSNSIGDEGARALLRAIEAAGLQTTLTELFLDDNDIAVLSEEVLRSGDPAAMLGWLASADQKPLWAAKIVILGNGEVGKTHFRKRVFQDQPFYYDEDELSTHNIEHLRTTTTEAFAEIIEEPEHTPEVHLLLWDFGGQKKLHSSHRFFLADRRNLFVILCDATKSRKENRLDYWLNLVRFETSQRAASEPDHAEHTRHEAQGDARPAAAGPPVVVVVTGCDRVATGAPRGLELPSLERLQEETGSNVVEIVEGFGWRDGLLPEVREALQPIHTEAIKKVKRAIARTVPGIPGVSTPYPGAFFEVAEWIEHNFPHAGDHGPTSDRSQKMLSMGAYIKACRDAGLDSSLRQICLRDMRNLGLVHFVGDSPEAQQHNDLKDRIFNPRWVKGPVYALIRAAQADHARGIISPRQLGQLLSLREEGDPEAKELWGRLPFNDRERDCILSLMKACELVFEVEGEHGVASGSLLVPDLLETRKGVFVPPPSASGWRITYKYLPEWVILRFIGGRRKSIADIQTGLYRNQVLLTGYGCEALVRGDIYEGVIEVWITGEENERQQVFGSIRDGLDRLYYSIESTEQPGNHAEQDRPGKWDTVWRGLWAGVDRLWGTTVTSITETAMKAARGEV